MQVYMLVRHLIVVDPQQYRK